jgi:CO/xanthine dehydrogenase Mo-binding subunit
MWRLKYAADLKFANTLHVKLVRLDVGHARIRSIDTAEACDLEGVHFVLTDQDLPVPMPRYGPFFSDQPIIATGEVKFFGDPVAAVVAETEDLAEKAARLVKVDYEELPGVYTIEQALMPGAPLVQDPSIRTNPSWPVQIYWMSGDSGGATLTIKRRTWKWKIHFNFPMTTHFAIEPHVFIAAPDHDGVIIWSTVQHPFLLQRVLSQALKIPLSKIRIVVPELGGGFGGKGYPEIRTADGFSCDEIAAHRTPAHDVG